MVQELGSLAEASKDPTTQTSTPKFMEEVATEVTKAYKATKSNHGNCESKYAEFEYGSKHFEEQIGQRGEGEGNVTRRIG